MPAKNKRPKDCSAATAYKIRVTEGGNKIPKVPPAATSPAESPADYPLSRLSGMAELPRAEHVAALDPAMAAKSPQAKVTAMPKPPGTLLSQMFKAE